MKTNQAYRYELAPTVRQRKAFLRHAGVARFAWNWGLAERIRLFEENEGKERFTSSFGQQKELNNLKKTDFPWMHEVSKCAPQESLNDLDKAFKKFRKEKKAGFPRFKRKGRCRDSFRLTMVLPPLPRRVKLPRLGLVKTKEDTSKFKGRILSATVSREADRWFVSFNVERERPNPKPIKGSAVGVDLGLKDFAVFSDGTKIQSPKPLARSLKRLKRLSRQHSRKVKGSNNRRRHSLRLARLHRRIRNQRLDFLHKVTSNLTKTKSVIVIEDLNVAGMVRNHKLARQISDAGWGEFRRQLEYKTGWYGSELLVAPRFYPSSKTCSSCGYVLEKLDLSTRKWVCPTCGSSHDRDINAAVNLLKLFTESSSGSYACEDPSTGAALAARYGSLKQELQSSVGAR